MLLSPAFFCFTQIFFSSSSFSKFSHHTNIFLTIVVPHFSKCIAWKSLACHERRWHFEVHVNKMWIDIFIALHTSVSSHFAQPTPHTHTHTKRYGRRKMKRVKDENVWKIEKYWQIILFTTHTYTHNSMKLRITSNIYHYLNWCLDMCLHALLTSTHTQNSWTRSIA